MFCPALTDGSIGDMIYFHSFKNPGLVLDIVQDIRALNERARMSKKAGMIILGGGVCKHQIANAMLIVSDTLCLHLPSTCGDLCKSSCLAQWCRLLCLHRTFPAFACTSTSPQSIFILIEHRPRIRRIRLWCSSRRGRLLGKDSSRLRVC